MAVGSMVLVLLEVYVKTLLLTLVILRALFRSSKILKFLSSLQKFLSFDRVIILIILFLKSKDVYGM